MTIARARRAVLTAVVGLALAACGTGGSGGPGTPDFADRELFLTTSKLPTSGGDLGFAVVNPDLLT